MKYNIPFSPPDITDVEIEEVTEALKSGWITTGPRTKLLEKTIADYCKVSKCVCFNSATAAMELTLRLLGVRQGDEVITSAYTYTASASVGLHVGATIKLCDIKDGYEMDYDKLEEMITENTKVIIPVDIAGVVCDYKRIFEIVEKKKRLFHGQTDLQEAFGRIVVMADAAHSFGGERDGIKSGNLADFTAFSFHAVKNLTTAEGGAVVWRDIIGVDNDKLYQDYMLLSLHGQSKDALSKTQLGAWEYDIISPSYKCNMTDITAAMGLAQMKRYDDILKRRIEIIELYNKYLSDAPVEILSHQGENFKSSCHLYMIRLTGKDEAYRNDMMIKLAENGIAANVHYKPLPMHTAYKYLGFEIKNFPVSYETYQNEITLPLHTLLKDDEIKYITDTLKMLLEKKQEVLSRR